MNQALQQSHFAISLIDKTCQDLNVSMQNALHAEDIIQNKNVAPDDVNALGKRFRELRLILIPMAESELALLQKQHASLQKQHASLKEQIAKDQEELARLKKANSFLHSL